MTLYSPQLWDVWLAHLLFENHTVGKVRPVLILEVNTESLLVAKITTGKGFGNYEYISIRDWESAGLKKPSQVQINPLVEMAPSALLRDRFLGTLADADKATLKEHFQ